MIFRDSLLKVIDDSGVSLVKCLRTLQYKAWATLGDLIKVSVRKRFYNATVLKRTLCIALIVNMKRKRRRLSGIYIACEGNCAFMIDDDQKGLLMDESLKEVYLLPKEAMVYDSFNLKLFINNVI